MLFIKCKCIKLHKNQISKGWYWPLLKLLSYLSLGLYIWFEESINNDFKKHHKPGIKTIPLNILYK